MRTEHSHHLDSLNDFIVQITLHNCDPNKLLGYFQRNEVKSIPYETNNGYYQTYLINFFSKENADFLYSEICYFDNKTKNPELRRRTIRIFENLCILLTYLDNKLDKNDLLKHITYFIKKLDFSVHDISVLAHPLLAKPDIFAVNDILNLVKVIIAKDRFQDGYILTNCLHILNEKKYLFVDSDEKIVNSLISTSLSKSEYGLLKVLPGLLPIDQLKILKTSIAESLSNKFNSGLFYEAVTNKCLESPELFIDNYLNFFSSISNSKKVASIFNYSSPYTGINEPLRRHLNNLVEVVFTINNDRLIENDIIHQIQEYHPYYKNILDLNLLNYSSHFKAIWVLENDSEIILEKLSNNPQLYGLIKDELMKNHNKELATIFIKYFTK